MFGIGKMSRCRSSSDRTSSDHTFALKRCPYLVPLAERRPKLLPPWDTCSRAKIKAVAQVYDFAGCPPENMPRCYQHPTLGLVYGVSLLANCEGLQPSRTCKIRLGFFRCTIRAQIKRTNIKFKGPCWIHYIRTPVGKGSPDSDASLYVQGARSSVHGKAAQTAP